MNIQEIYEKFDKIGAFTFATIENGRPRTRIAHLFAYDDEGIYFRTMTTKPFYTQLKKTEKVALGGMYPNSAVIHDENGMPEWEPGYTVNLTGDVREISLDRVKQKAAVEPMFELGVKDIERYPAMTTLCIYRGFGEVFDFDFEMKLRSHKLLRTPFSFGGIEIPFRGVRITEDCIHCGECIQKCSFNAISEDVDGYTINQVKCDVCGDCTTVCPANAIEVVCEG
jgi:ferredoxin